jgi:uncharacterized membrane protein
VALRNNQLIIFIVVALLTGIVYILTMALNMSIVFIIGLNLLLVSIGLLSATHYDPKPYVKYAAAAGTIIFLFIVVQTILEVMGLYVYL